MKYLLAIALLSLSACASSGPSAYDLRSEPVIKFDEIKPAAGLARYPNFQSIEEVNRYVNKTPYVRDIGNDWKTPERFFAEGGDCEDYAVAKYFILLSNKLVDENNASIVLAWDRRHREYHAVLIVDNKVLDNQTDQILDYAEAQTQYRFVGRVQ